MKVLTSEEMREAERWTAEHGTPLDVLMRNAAQAAADTIVKMLQAGHKDVAFAVGPGNNGGDGLVAAALLADRGYRTVAGVVLRKIEPDLPMLQAVTAGVEIVDMEDPAGIGQFETSVREAGLVVDALFGTGRIRPIGGAAARALETLAKRRPGIPLLAIDLPSGLNADTGEIDPLTPLADRTITFGSAKRGLFLAPGSASTGEVQIADIGIPEGATHNVTAELMDAALARSLLPDRPSSGHKGTFGKVMVVSGSIRYVGAPFLVCSAAGRAGSGIVTLATGESTYRLLAGKLIESTFLPLAENATGQIAESAPDLVLGEMAHYDSLVVGPGLGRSKESDSAVLRILQEVSVPAVIDADAINVLSTLSDWQHALPKRCVLTPHSGELARLLDTDIAGVEKNRWETATSIAARANRTVIVKGAHTLVAEPDGTIAVSPFANPALSTGGTGDVLSGIIGGLLAQGMSTRDAALLGVYIHGAAAARWSDRNGVSGLLASDLLTEIPIVQHSLRSVT